VLLGVVEGKELSVTELKASLKLVPLARRQGR
jgi:hypothetical protein